MIGQIVAEFYQIFATCDFS